MSTRFDKNPDRGTRGAFAVGAMIVNGVPMLGARKRVTNAQMLALLGTDVELISSPGPGQVVLVESAFLYFDSAGAYTLGTAALAIGYGSDGADIFAITEAGFLDQATDQARYYVLGGAVASPAIITPTANVGVVLRATTADLTGGNAANSLSIVLSYSIHEAAPF